MLMSATCAGQKINNLANSLPLEHEVATELVFVVCRGDEQRLFQSMQQWCNDINFSTRSTWTRALRRGGMQKVYDGFMLDAVRVLSFCSCVQCADDEQRVVVRYMVYLRLVIDKQMVVSHGQTVLDSCIRQIAESCMGNNIKIIEASACEYPPLV